MNLKSKDTPIHIIGAGIGGLTTALCLRQKGFNVVVFEAAPEILPVGSGIILAINAMQILQKLGVVENLQKLGNYISCMQITDPELSPLSTLKLSDFEKLYQAKTLAIHRADLQKILYETVGPENVHLSKQLVKLEKNKKFTLFFDDQTYCSASTIIAADGIHSVIRNQHFLINTIRNAEQICWRGVCNFTLPENFSSTAYEAWGRGKRFGFVKINSKQIYWYALINTASRWKLLSKPNGIFVDFHKLVEDLINLTNPDKIIKTEISDSIPLKSWSRENICLLGDAAHATTPNIGQGACQAIEDAYVLGNCLEQNVDTHYAFQQYEKLRIQKATEVTHISWRIGQISQWENRAAIEVRNLAMKYAPDFLNKRFLKKILHLDYEKEFKSCLK